MVRKNVSIFVKEGGGDVWFSCPLGNYREAPLKIENGDSLVGYLVDKLDLKELKSIDNEFKSIETVIRIIPKSEVKAWVTQGDDEVAIPYTEWEKDQNESSQKI